MLLKVLAALCLAVGSVFIGYGYAQLDLIHSHFTRFGYGRECFMEGVVTMLGVFLNVTGAHILLFPYHNRNPFRHHSPWADREPPPRHEPQSRETAPGGRRVVTVRPVVERSQLN